MRSGKARLVFTLAETVVSTLIVFALLQTFVERTYAVEQTSMEPTLEPDQRLIIDRLTPRFDPYKPGDIVAFEPPPLVQEDSPLIKRVIAVAGSVVEIRGGRVVVDGAPLDEPYVFEGQPTTPRTAETRWTVPAGQLFVLGDHRAVSVDSRTFGPIAVSTVIGRAWLRFYPLDEVRLIAP